MITFSSGPELCGIATILVQSAMYSRLNNKNLQRTYFLPSTTQLIVGMMPQSEGMLGLHPETTRMLSEDQFPSWWWGLLSHPSQPGSPNTISGINITKNTGLFAVDHPSRGCSSRHKSHCVNDARVKSFTAALKIMKYQVYCYQNLIASSFLGIHVHWHVHYLRRILSFILDASSSNYLLFMTRVQHKFSLT
jgi:hypothetical protein